MAKSIQAIADEVIISKIYFIRGQKVMLDRDLAAFYYVTTGNLNKAVKRNLKRFPDDFLFQLTAEEYKNLIFQNGTSNLHDSPAPVSVSKAGIPGWGGTRKPANAFTEQGVAMLSSVLNSDIAIEINIRIIRIFTKLREMLLTHKDIMLKLEQLEKQVTGHDGVIQRIFSILKQLLAPPSKPRKRIGFKWIQNQD